MRVLVAIERNAGKDAAKPLPPSTGLRMKMLDFERRAAVLLAAARHAASMALAAYAAGCTPGNTAGSPVEAGPPDALAVDGPPVPTSEPPPVPSNVVHTYAPTFQAVYDEILRPTCASLFCHLSDEYFMNALTADTAFATLVGAVTDSPECGSTGLARVVPRHPEQSLLYLKLTDPPCGQKMPLNFGSQIDVREVVQVRSWIERGALRDEPIEAGATDAASDASLQDGAPSTDGSPADGALPDASTEGGAAPSDGGAREASNSDATPRVDGATLAP